jgi:hypothetical protein
MQSFLIFLLILFFNTQCIISPVSPKRNDSTQSTAISLFLLVEALKPRCNTDSGGFWVRDLLLSNQASYCVQSSLVASNSSVDIYLQNGLSTNLNYNTIAERFDTSILPIMKQAIGIPSDINKDNKITILILDIRDGATASSGFIAGYVDPVNFFGDNPAFTIRSNQREILFMDGAELVRLRDRDLAAGRPDTFLSTLAHELQHLIRYSYSNGADDIWIDEGTSEVTSDITGYGPQTARLNCFKGDSTSSNSCAGGIGSTSTNSPSLFSWRGTLKNYAFSYAFMRYLYDISGNTDALRYQFFQSTVQGKNAVRANNATNLINLFMQSSGYNSSVLSTVNTSVFQRLYASFIAQSAGYTSLSQTYIGNTSVQNMDSVRTTYPFSSVLSVLPTPSPFSAISSAGSYSLSPSQVNRVTGTTTGIVNNLSDFVAVQGTGSFVIMNAGLNNSSSSSTVQASLLNDTEEGIICPQHFINEDVKIKSKNLNLKSLLEN